MSKHRRMTLSRNGLRIEAPGCIIYIEGVCSNPFGGTRVDIIPDGERFAGQRSTAEVVQPNGNSVIVHVEVSRA